MKWKDKWFRQDAVPETLNERGQILLNLAIVVTSGNVFPAGIFQTADQVRPDCGAGPQEDCCTLLKCNEMKAGGGPRTMQ